MNLLREDIVEKLHKTVESNNHVIIKLSLKLVSELLRDNKVKELALPSFKYSFVDRLCYFITEVNSNNCLLHAGSCLLYFSLMT